MGASDVADIPGVSQGRSFTLASADGPRRFAVAHRADALFVMFGPVSESFDAAAVNQVAVQQYERL